MANPKETDLTYLRAGQPVSISIDAYPGRIWHGTVASLSPGTGAEFAVLPAQNASGNWVKVIQRVPVRIEFVDGGDLTSLRTGMSAQIEIDSGHTRSLASLIGIASAAHAEGQ
jgi:membrane fusion protein (multidrug efflux system)